MYCAGGVNCTSRDQDELAWERLLFACGRWIGLAAIFREHCAAFGRQEVNEVIVSSAFIRFVCSVSPLRGAWPGVPPSPCVVSLVACWPGYKENEMCGSSLSCAVRSRVPPSAVHCTSRRCMLALEIRERVSSFTMVPTTTKRRTTRRTRPSRIKRGWDFSKPQHGGERSGASPGAPAQRP